MEKETTGPIAEAEHYLSKFNSWIGRSQQLWAALSELSQGVKEGHSTVPKAAETTIDPRLPLWLDRSRNVLNSRLQQAIATLQNSSTERAGGTHPANMPFGILGDTSTARLNETVHTGLLAWFLDPTKPHGFGDELVRAVLRLTKLALLADEPDFSVDTVVAEQPVPGGRIDIFAEGKTGDGAWSLWLEAKTVSVEGKQQLARYESAIDSWIGSAASPGARERVAPVFLTPSGRDPRTASNSRYRTYSWVPIGYDRLAMSLWRTAAQLEGGAGRELLRLYLASVLHDLAGWPRPLTGNVDFDVLDIIGEIV